MTPTLPPLTKLDADNGHGSSSPPTATATHLLETGERDPYPGGDTLETFPLPALPTPDHRTMRKEAKCGISNVVFIIVLIVGLTHALPLNRRVGSLPADAYLACFVIIHACAVLALASLERVIRSDPGVIRRSNRTCFPVPEPVRQRLLANAPLDDIRNVYIDATDAKRDGSSYCVRCCVWRPPRSHHCSTCQRCVTHFDHHCSFYGRCIAGTWRTGNMRYFVGLIVLGYVAFFAFLVFLVWAIVGGTTGSSTR